MNAKVLFSLSVAAMAAVPLASLSTGCATRHYDTTGAYVDDKKLTARVKSDLARDPVAKASTINVTTYNREVQLSGFVATEQEKVRAAQIAATVPGVVTVHNNLIVRTGR